MVTSGNDPHAATGRSYTAKRRDSNLDKNSRGYYFGGMNFKPILQTLTV